MTEIFKNSFKDKGLNSKMIFFDFNFFGTIGHSFSISFHLWQSLMFRSSYRCGYCVAVCPAGEEIKSFYLQNKSAYIQQVLKPLQDRAELV